MVGAHMRTIYAITLTPSGATSVASLQSPAAPAVFASAEAARGRQVYAAECASCHGVRLNDGNAIALVGGAFLDRWSHPQVTLDDLFYVIQTTMPRNRAG